MPEVNMITNYPSEWMGMYVEGNKKKTDPVVSYMVFKNSPVYWNRLMMLDKFRKTEQQLFMHKAKQFGLANGLSIPIYSVSGDIAVFVNA